MRKSILRFTLSLTLLLPFGALAEDLDADDREAFLTVLEAIEEGWETASEPPFRRHFTNAPDAHFVESGGADVGLDHLLSHHVVPEGDALADLSLDLDPIEMHAGPRYGWILARTEFRAVVRRDGRRLHSRGFETVVLARDESGWTVLHSHGSSRPVEEADHEPQESHVEHEEHDGHEEHGDHDAH